VKRSHGTEGDKDIAKKYFVPAAAIRDFMPVEFRPCDDNLFRGGLVISPRPHRLTPLVREELGFRPI
jgi:hypothetical protein